MWSSGPQGHFEGGATPLPVCKGTDVTSAFLTTQAARTPDQTSLTPEETSHVCVQNAGCPARLRACTANLLGSGFSP